MQITIIVTMAMANKCNNVSIQLFSNVVIMHAYVCKSWIIISVAEKDMTKLLSCYK